MINTYSISELKNKFEQDYEQFRKGERMDFESELFCRKLQLVETLKFIRRYADKIKPDNPAKIEFDGHAHNLQQLLMMEDVLDREMRSYKHRSEYLESVLMDVKMNSGKTKEVPEDFMALTDKIERLEAENQRLIKLIK